MKRNIIIQLIISLVLVSGFQTYSQCTLPVITVRFANPQYNCDTRTYCLDVEFHSDTPGQQLFEMNMRFFYDDDVLEILSMGNFEQGYVSPKPTQKSTGHAGSGNSFGLSGNLEWVNGTVKLVSPSPIYISSNTDEWTRLFSVCFRVDNASPLGLENFCPSIIWDMQENSCEGGYLAGDDGLALTVVGQPPLESLLTTENVEQFNWQYDTSGDSFGFHVSNNCITEKCGYVIPLSNWALYMAIMLMLITTVIIWRRRMNS